jgi:hypothetical protein
MHSCNCYAILTLQGNDLYVNRFFSQDVENFRTFYNYRLSMAYFNIGQRLYLY